MSGSVDYSEVLQLRRQLSLAQTLAPRRTDDWLHNVVGPELLAEMQDRAPVDTGALRDSLAQVNSPGEVSVGTHGISYVVYVVEGTRPHAIEAKKSSTLVFKVNGMTVFAKRVQHPGTAPNPFMEDAAKAVIRRNLPRLAALVMDMKKSG